MFTSKSNEPFAHYYLNETLVTPEESEKSFKILSENTVNVGGMNLSTLTYKQCLQSFGRRNWNGRIYDKATTMKALDSNPLIQHDIANKSWAAEYGHPSVDKNSNQLSRQMTIDPTKACNTINKYWLEGDLLMGECTTLAGGWGDVVMRRCLTGFPPMASSRAIGGVDKNGNVLPGYTIVTFDTVIRPSHKEAYEVKGSERVNNFSLDGSAPTGNVMTESVSKIDITGKDAESFRDFILTESSSRDQINILCEALNLDYDTLTIDEHAVVIKKINESSIQTVRIPLRKLIASEYYRLF